MTWAIAEMGGVEGKNCLELGPLDGGNSYMIQQAGAQHITAIKSNSRAFLRCLCVKEILSLNRVSFRLKDFTKHLETCRKDNTSYDAVFANGVLYHMKNPAQVISDICHISDQICVWTHYYDHDIIAANSVLTQHHKKPSNMSFDGLDIYFSKRKYKEAFSSKIYCGGTADYSIWLERATILVLLERYGFKRVDIAFETPGHPHGPAFAFVAKR